MNLCHFFFKRFLIDVVRPKNGRNLQKEKIYMKIKIHVKA